MTNKKGVNKMTRLEKVIKSLELCFVIIESYNDGDILVDKQTGVMYWKTTAASNSGNLTLLVNADGTPKIWKGDRK